MSTRSIFGQLVRANLAVCAASLLTAASSNAAVVNTALTFSDMTLSPASGVWSDGGGNNIGMSRLNIGNTSPAPVQSALTAVTNFIPGTNFSVTGSFSVATNENGSSGTTTNRQSTFAVTLFGDTANNEIGVFASLNIYENRGSYDGGQRLGVGTNVPRASLNYVGNFAGNGDATTGETFLTGANLNLADGATPTYTFTISVSYDTATQVDISFLLSDGTNSNTLSIADADITGLQTNNVFGVITSQRNRSLAGTFSNITVNQIPEPASLVLAGLGGLMMFGRRRRSA